VRLLPEPMLAVLGIGNVAFARRPHLFARETGHRFAHLSKPSLEEKSIQREFEERDLKQSGDKGSSYTLPRIPTAVPYAVA
ncbi:MAG: hypothetical protein Q9197_004865, partial [Variospora fuerteventurae]